MMTEVNTFSTSAFEEDQISIHLKKKQAHTDGITSIEVIKEN